MQRIDLDAELSNIEAHDQPTLKRTIIPSEIYIPENLDTRQFTVVNPKFNWLFAFLMDVEDQLSGHKEAIHNLLNSNALILILENAFGWGNKHDPNRPIQFAIYVGNKGVIIRVEDSGKGFDATKVIHKYDEHDFGDAGEFENTGYGMRFLAQSDFDIIYEGPANVVYIIDRFK